MSVKAAETGVYITSILTIRLQVYSVGVPEPANKSTLPVNEQSRSKF